MTDPRRQWEVTAGVPRPGEDFPGADWRSLHVPGSSLVPGSASSGGEAVSSAPEGGYALTRHPALPNADWAMQRELDRFCWGGLLWGGLWALYHRVWIGLIALIPGVGLPMCLVLGLRGRRWAWQRCRHGDINRFFRAQYWWGLSWVIAAPVLLPATVAAGAAGLYVGQGYLRQQRVEVARQRLSALGEGIGRCAEEARGKLPTGSDWVPAQLSLVAGRAFAVPELEWRSQAAFRCADFAPRDAVSFQFRWMADASTIGKAVARADLDGDGRVDHRLSVVVTCGERGCQSSPPIAEALVSDSKASE